MVGGIFLSILRRLMTRRRASVTIMRGVIIQRGGGLYAKIRRRLALATRIFTGIRKMHRRITSIRVARTTRENGRLKCRICRSRRKPRLELTRFQLVALTMTRIRLGGEIAHIIKGAVFAKFPHEKQ